MNRLPPPEAEGVLDAFRGPHLMVDPNSQTIGSWNAEAEAAYGRPEPGATTCFSLFYRRDRSCTESGFPCPLEGVSQGADSAPDLFDHVPCGGMGHFCRVRAIPFQKGRDETPWVILAHSEIDEATYRHRHRDLHQHIVQGFGEPVLLLDPGGVFDCNPAALRFFGVADRDDLLGRHPAELSDITQPDGRPSREAADEYIRQALDHGQVAFQWLHKSPQGPEVTAEVRLFRIDGYGGPVVAAEVHEVTESLWVRQALADTRAQARQYLDLLPAPAIALAPEGEVETVNSAFSSAVGHPPEAIEGSADLERFLPPTAAREVWNCLERIVSDGVQEAQSLAIPLGPADDSARLHQFTAHTLRDPTGRPHRVLLHGGETENAPEGSGAGPAHVCYGGTPIPLHGLTAREYQVFEHLTEGLTNKEVAQRLGVSPRTVEEHRSHILTKLDIRTFAELISLTSSSGSGG